MTATIAGMLIPDLIEGRENVWAHIYDPSYPVPSRFTVAVKSFIRDTVGYLKKGVGYIDDAVTTATGMKSSDAGSPQKELKEDVCTEGLHTDGNIYWNNDEESWDRIKQRRTIAYNQK